MERRVPAPAVPRAAQELAERTERAFKERRRAARRAAFVRALRWAVPAAALAGIAALVWLSPVFAVRAGDIEVQGLGGWIDRAEVSRVLADDVGTPLIRVRPGATEQRLEALSAVEDAIVRRDWPTGLVVELVPRVAAAAVLDGESYVLLDASGAQVVRVDEPPEGLPVIQVPLTDGNKRVVAAVLRVVASLPQWLASQVGEIGGETEDTVTFKLSGGVQVVWGDSEDAAVKAAAVEVLLKEPGVTSIDVSAPKAPVVR